MFNIIRYLKALMYSLAGIRALLIQEPAFRLECLVFIIMTPFALWLGQTKIQQALLIGAMMMVLIVEAINSAIETVVDRISQQRHPLSGRAKDIASAAVLLSIINALIIWVLMLL